MRESLRNILANSPKSKATTWHEGGSIRTMVEKPAPCYGPPNQLGKPRDTTISSLSMHSLDQELSLLQPIGWVALIAFMHYIIFEFLAHQLASNLLVFIICFLKKRKMERKKEDNLHFLIQNHGLFIIACTSLIKMINECIVTEP